MYIVFLCSAIALLLTYLESRGLVKGGMKWGFVLVTILGMIHYDYGNDYMSYYETFNEVTQYIFDFDAILSKTYHRDPGWVILCYAFKPIGGFFMMVAVLNVIQNMIVYRFIKDNVELKWRPFSVFIYLFSTSFYLLSFSMMRQMLVMIVFLGLWKYIIQRKWWIALIVIYACSFIHNSALVLLPFAFWGFVPTKNPKYVAIGYVSLFALLWLTQNYVNYLFMNIAALNDGFSTYVDTYENDKFGLTVSIGYYITLIPFVLSFLFLLSKKDTHAKENILLVALGSIAFLITPFSQIASLTARIGYYFAIYSIAAYPLVYGNIKSKSIRSCLLSVNVLLTMYSYYMFFKEGVYVEKYSTFHTIFGQLF